VRIRTKFLAALLIELITFAVLSGLTVATFARVRAMMTVVESGTSLISMSRSVYSLLKDVVFDLFTPMSYQSLRSVVLAPRSLVTGREFAHETGLFKDQYRAFMDDPTVKYILSHDAALLSMYKTSDPLAMQAFTKFGKLSELFDRLRTISPASETADKDLYQIIQESKDESLYSVFGEIRDASFYLNNIFESFLNRFVLGIRQRSEHLERSAIIALAASILMLGAVMMLIVYLISSGIIASVKDLQVAIGSVAEGDFSVRVPKRGKDELAALGGSFERLAGDLKRNVESIPSILKDVNEALPEEPNWDEINNILSEALLREGGARGVCIFLRQRGMVQLIAKSGFDPLPAWEKGTSRRPARAGFALPDLNDRLLIKHVAAGRFDFDGAGFDHRLATLLVVPMAIRKKNSGYFLFAREDRAFTDLEISRLSAIADYAAQVLDNVEMHATLAARRDASFEALQAQIRPHFLYNILTSIMALNRMGESKRLEEAVIALKDMLRYTLEPGQWTTVIDEFAFLEKYCELQKLRYGERFDFSIEAAPECEEARIPKLIVQPLVENAFIHGIEPRKSEGRLTVSCALVEPNLVIRVADNGPGCDAAKLEELASLKSEDASPHARSGRVGLGNVRRRLDLVYKEAALTFESRSGEGFAASITIPIKECAIS